MNSSKSSSSPLYVSLRYILGTCFVMTLILIVLSLLSMDTNSYSNFAPTESSTLGIREPGRSTFARLPRYAQNWYQYYEGLNSSSVDVRKHHRYAHVLMLGTILPSSALVSVSELLAAFAVAECSHLPVKSTYHLYIVDPQHHLHAEVKKLVSSIVRQNCSYFDINVGMVSFMENNELVRGINDAMLDAFLDREAEYFRLTFVLSKEGQRSYFTAELDHVIDQMLPISGIGIVVDFVENSWSVYFSALHFEVFGWFLPPSVTEWTVAVELLCAVYVERNLLKSFRSDATFSNTATAVWRINSSISSNGSQLFRETLSTLDRYMSARLSNRCWRCFFKPSGDKVHVISMSLYGDNRRYTLGAVRNAQLLPVTFPGWRLRFYVELPLTDSYAGGSTKYTRVPEVILKRLAQLGADLIPVGKSGSEAQLAPMLWRFQAAVDETVDFFIIRDVDSRLTPRDSAVVSDWLNRGDKAAAFHCVRDHPSHSSYPVSGGMWGGQPRLLAKALAKAEPSPLDLASAMLGYSASYLDDMNFLNHKVWPRIHSDAFCHDSFSCDRYPASHPFPIARQGSEHIGQVYFEYEVGRQIDVNLLVNAPVNKKCVP